MELGLFHLVSSPAKISPILRNSRTAKQGGDGLVPGGWMIYMLIEPAPGIPLGYVEGGLEYYWCLPDEVREEIMRAFQSAWWYATCSLFYLVCMVFNEEGLRQSRIHSVPMEPIPYLGCKIK